MNCEYSIKIRSSTPYEKAQRLTTRMLRCNFNFNSYTPTLQLLFLARANSFNSTPLVSLGRGLSLFKRFIAYTNGWAPVLIIDSRLRSFRRNDQKSILRRHHCNQQVSIALLLETHVFPNKTQQYFSFQSIRSTTINDRHTITTRRVSRTVRGQ